LQIIPRQCTYLQIQPAKSQRLSMVDPTHRSHFRIFLALPTSPLHAVPLPMLKHYKTHLIRTHTAKQKQQQERSRVGACKRENTTHSPLASKKMSSKSHVSSVVDFANCGTHEDTRVKQKTLHSAACQPYTNPRILCFTNGSRALQLVPNQGCVRRRYQQRNLANERQLKRLNLDLDLDLDLSQVVR
jgi:hypothetical protein